MNPLPTKDGSFSLYSEKYGDFYHSTKDGAILETLYKHIIPTFALLQIVDLPNRTKNPIKILDICFGLGYNALFSLAFAKKCGLKVAIHSVELHLLESLRDFAYPKILSHYLPLREILDSLFLRGAWECENLSLYLHKGDAKIYLQNLADSQPKGQNIADFVNPPTPSAFSSESQTFDIIYQDAFSPTKNAELWDESHFQNLYTLLKNNGAISTYSTNKKMREICQNIGFEIYNMQSGNLKNGTILRKNSLNLHNSHQNFRQDSHDSRLPQSLQIDCIRLQKIQPRKNPQGKS